jgi:hypothetical protein
LPLPFILKFFASLKLVNFGAAGFGFGVCALVWMIAVSAIPAALHNRSMN